MYPLNMTSSAGGYAVANDVDEHRSLTSSGYQPALVEADDKPRRGRPPKAADASEEVTLDSPAE